MKTDLRQSVMKTDLRRLLILLLEDEEGISEEFWRETVVFANKHDCKFLDIIDAVKRIYPEPRTASGVWKERLFLPKNHGIKV